MQLKALARPTHTPIGAPIPRRLSRPSIFLNNQFTPRLRNSTTPPPLSIRISHKNNLRNRFLTACTSASHELIEEDKLENDTNVASVSLSSEEEEVVVEVVESKREDLANQSIWKQMKEIVMFSGPATGLWICGPLMSLISTAVIGRGSSTELAALGPGTVFCDNMNLLFMFLSIATSNMVATSLAKRDKNEVQHQISILLFVGITCGTLMLLFTQFLGPWALTAFAGPKNVHIVPAASKYVQIRGLAWPAILFGLVAQSASLGMKDSLDL
ncbi:hypothetical protein RGQ29_032012 [Quercus rubra]|uniref:Uncharacterized protein n=1 Tax=Quercus rubra TaxID=3512 RepID=A0AAN7DUE7_QUERU|nr:hypothetical protein RGQ29_032012 [Quercus rubra]